MNLPDITRKRIEGLIGRSIRSATPLSGGCIADVVQLKLDDGETCVAKMAAPDDHTGHLAIEAQMLSFLAANSRLPVPGVIAAAGDVLLMEYIEAGSPIDHNAERHAAELLVELHSLTAPTFGFEQDTVIGPLRQPNPQRENWTEFFRDQRLLHMGRVALERGHLPAASFKTLETFCGKLDDFLPANSKPALLHGDVWDGNVLVRNGRVAAFIDPAIYYGEPEIELAFSTLFGTFGESFFARYQEIRPLEPGFFETRRDIYNLYPLLVHTALFGSSYAASVAATLRKFS